MLTSSASGGPWGRCRVNGMTPMSVEAVSPQADDRDQKRAALGYVQGAWSDARLDGIDDDCMAQSCLFVAFMELVSTYGEQATAEFAERFPTRILNGEFSLDRAHQ
jgi:hypothetical protein